MTPQVPLSDEQRRLVTQIRKHVDANLSNLVWDFFMSGRSVGDLKDVIVIAGEERKVAP